MISSAFMKREGSLDNGYFDNHINVFLIVQIKSKLKNKFKYAI